ncbi:MAG: hypothetical protein KDB27_17415 [Planctomycetales bacterium]|nr:hypothetical protein [Planctomycetales bacterium]
MIPVYHGQRGLTGDGEDAVTRDICLIRSVLILPGKLPPTRQSVLR